MESTFYTPVDNANLENEENKSYRKYLLRQIFICMGIWASIFCYGLSFGSPTVVIAQIRREANSSDAVSIEMESWLSSTYNYSGAVNTVIICILARLIGRKHLFTLISITSAIGYIIFYFSTTIIQLLISEVVHGSVTACQMTLSIMILTEYTSPRYRGIFMTIKSATFFWGVWVSNAIGTFVHWKNIGILGFICSIFSTITSIFWPESPYWLANNNRFEDCAMSHRWLKGIRQKSEEELETLIQSRKIGKPLIIKSRSNARNIIKIFTSKTFYKPIAIVFLVLAFYNFSGKIACGMYSIDIIKRITENESTAYLGMLILDGITVLGMYIGCFLSKVFKRRTLLLVASSIGITFLFILSFYLHLIHFDIISENTTVSISILVMYSLAISVGPMIICTTIIGELTPIKLRHLFVLVMCVFAQILMATMLKICPFIIYYFGARGLFLFFAVLALSCTVTAYKVLPETKDKTIFEIQQGILAPESDIKLTERQLLHK